MAILSDMLAILGHFSRFSPDDHLDTCFSDQQDFTESTLMLYILRYSYFKAQYPEKQGKWPLYAPEWPYLVLFGHFFLLEPFGLYLSMLHVEGMRLFHPFEKMVKVLLPEKGPKIEKNGHSKCYAGHFGPFF